MPRAAIKPWLHWNIVLVAGVLVMLFGLGEAGLELSRRGQGRWLTVLIWLFVAFVGYGVFVWGSRRRWRAQPMSGYCPSCWYDLRGGNRATCPECGTEIPARLRPSSGSTPADRGPVRQASHGDDDE